MSATENPQWWIVKAPDGTCQIQASGPAEPSNTEPPAPEHWGPFATQGEAIAKRVGLIRTGKCQPQ